MKTCPTLSLLALLLLLAAPASALTRQEFAVREDSLKAAIKRVANSTDTVQRLRLNSIFAAQLEQTLREDSAFFYPFEAVPFLYQVASPNGLVRVITWNVPAPRRQHYFGYVLTRASKKSPSATLHQLRDNRKPTKVAEDKTLGTDEWFGALYVALVERNMPGNNQPTYTLLGLSPTNNGRSNKKVVDVLCVDGKGKCTFGAPIFSKKNRVLHRLIFEYSQQAVMDLLYHEGTRQIVFSSLIPMYAQLRGQYEQYITGEGYDALKFSNGQWLYRENVKLPSSMQGVRKVQEKRASEKGK
jgi:hypothetical protein